MCWKEKWSSSLTSSGGGVIASFIIGILSLIRWKNFKDYLKQNENLNTRENLEVLLGKNFEKDKFEKNFNEAFWHWATIGRDLKQLDKLKEKVEEMQSNFSPRNK